VFLVLTNTINLGLGEGDGALSRRDKAGVEPKPQKSLRGFSIEEFELDITLND
jgi:hypothetical protein